MIIKAENEFRDEMHDNHMQIFFSAPHMHIQQAYTYVSTYINFFLAILIFALYFILNTDANQKHDIRG